MSEIVEPELRTEVGTVTSPNRSSFSNFTRTHSLNSRSSFKDKKSQGRSTCNNLSEERQKLAKSFNGSIPDFSQPTNSEPSSINNAPSNGIFSAVIGRKNSKRTTKKNLSVRMSCHIDSSSYNPWLDTDDTITDPEGGSYSDLSSIDGSGRSSGKREVTKKQSKPVHQTNKGGTGLLRSLSLLKRVTESDCITYQVYNLLSYSHSFIERMRTYLNFHSTNKDRNLAFFSAVSNLKIRYYKSHWSRNKSSKIQSRISCESMDYNAFTPTDFELKSAMVFSSEAQIAEEVNDNDDDNWKHGNYDDKDAKKKDTTLQILPSTLACLHQSYEVCLESGSFPVSFFDAVCWEILNGIVFTLGSLSMADQDIMKDVSLDMEKVVLTGGMSFDDNSNILYRSDSVCSMNSLSSINSHPEDFDQETIIDIHDACYKVLAEKPMPTRQKLDLMTITSTALQPFVDILTLEHAAENLAFYMAVNRFQENFDIMTHREVKTKALINTFINAQARDEVNLSQMVKENLLNCKEPHSQMFKECQQQIYNSLNIHFKEFVKLSCSKLGRFFLMDKKF
eukprot:Awhi_evm1s11303